MNYRLPTKLADDRASRAQELVDESIVTTVSLYPGVRRIDFRVQVDNRARDHRLRVEFPAPIVTAYANADQAFDVVTRSLDLPNGAADWVEQPRPEAPMQNFVSVSDGKIGLTLATRGLPEYEARPHRNPPPSNGGENASGTTLALTLLRCVGWLSRNDLATRTGDAGPQKETPGAQEIGAHAFAYALIPHAGNWRHSFAEAHAFATPMRAVTTSARSPLLPSTPLRSAQDAGGGQGERSAASFVEASPREFVFSAIKLAEEGEGLVVRGYNIGNEPIDARIVLLSTLTALSVNSVEGWHGFTRAARVNLNEEEIAPIELHEGCAVELHVRAKEIVTVRFE